MKNLIFISISFLLVILTSCQQQPTLSISSQSALVSDSLSVTVSGLTSGQVISLLSETADQRGRSWVAQATYKADAYGNVDVGKSAPLSGSYTDKDGMGLFWSATLNGLPADSMVGVFSRRAQLSHKTTIKLQIDGVMIDSSQVVRRYLIEDVTTDSISHNGLRGILHTHSNSNIRGAVIVLAGSDGGLTSANWRAALLASSGIPALALAWFDYADLPEDLIEIPLEYLYKAQTFLKEEKGFKRIALLGFSKGSEYALSYTSRFPENGIDAIVAISPSTYVWQGINRNIDVKSSWSYNDEPLTFIPWQYNANVISMLRSREPKQFRKLYQYSLNSTSDDLLTKTQLNLTNSDAKVLLIAGTDDGSWPAAKMAERLYSQIQTSGISPRVVKHIFQDAGHLIYFDYLPVTDSRVQSGQVFGGTIEANINARRKAWKAIKNFLKSQLN